jgi:hypothetical protein
MDYCSCQRAGAMNKAMWNHLKANYPWIDERKNSECQHYSLQVQGTGEFK